MAWVKQEIYCKRLHVFENNELEILWLEIILCNVKLLLGVCYRPPNAKVEWWSKLNEMLNLIFESYSCHIVITGGFNCDPRTMNLKKII